MDEVYRVAKEKYEANHLLLNGIFYDHPYHHAIGHEFLLGDAFHNGSLTYRNITYDNIRLKYDIYNQQVLIHHTYNGSMVVILLPKEFITEFWMNGAYFKKLSFHEKEPSFFQVVYEQDQVKCCYSWYKMRYKSTHKESFISYNFSESKRKSYLYMDDKLSRYKNNRSFVRIFPDKIRGSIRSYLKSSGIEVNEADDETMKEVMQFCQSKLAQNKM